MLANDSNLNNHSSSAIPADLSKSDLQKILLGQDLHLRSHLKRAMLLIAVTVFVIVAHQAFVLLSYPITVVHSLLHITLLVTAVALVFYAWIIWSSYLRLHHHQSVMLDAYAHSEELNEKTGKNLNKSESLLESLFSVITDRILVVDSNNCIAKANRIAATWVGRDPTHCKFTEIFPNCDSKGERRNELSLIEYTRTTQEAHHGRLLRGGLDCSRLLSVDTYPVSFQGNSPDLVIAIARDVTQRTGRELVSRHREKMATLGLLVAGFAHDLGNPLASLASELELLREEDAGKIHQSLDTISEHVERIKRKLHEIVQFACRPDENKLDVDAREAINHALKLTRFDPRARRIHFNMEVINELPSILMKEDDLVLVLINLIINAFDAMPEGGTLSINASMTPTDDVLLTVTDTGIGMDAATLQQATQPLFTTKNINDGTGLGLTMVKQLIESIGGKLTLASEPGHGSQIMLRLPGKTDYSASKKRHS